jgi:hypothetical protein
MPPTSDHQPNGGASIATAHVSTRRARLWHHIIRQVDGHRPSERVGWLVRPRHGRRCPCDPSLSRVAGEVRVISTSPKVVPRLNVTDLDELAEDYELAISLACKGQTGWPQTLSDLRMISFCLRYVARRLREGQL